MNIYGMAPPSVGIDDGVARISGVMLWADDATETAQSILSAPSVPPTSAIAAKARLAMFAVFEGEAATAAKQYPEFLPLRDTVLQGALVSVDRLLGLLAHTMAELDQAMDHFEDAQTFCRKAGYRPELAWTCCDYADSLLQRNDPGDREKAMSLLDESLGISTEMGMRPLLERVLSRQEPLRT